MTDHRPECPTRVEYPDHGGVVIWDELACICDLLRACEARVRQDMALQYLVTDREQQEAEQRAYAAGLSAARNAVAALPQHWPNSPALHRGTALAAIDALRGES